MEHDRKPRNKPMHLWVHYFLTKEAIYNGAKENWTATCKRMKLEHFLTPCRKINSKQIKYLGINLPKETKELYTENYDTDERNQRQHKR